MWWDCTATSLQKSPELISTYFRPNSMYCATKYRLREFTINYFKLLSSIGWSDLTSAMLRMKIWTIRGTTIALYVVWAFDGNWRILKFFLLKTLFRYGDCAPDLLFQIGSRTFLCLEKGQENFHEEWVDFVETTLKVLFSVFSNVSCQAIYELIHIHIDSIYGKIDTGAMREK